VPSQVTVPRPAVASVRHRPPSTAIQTVSTSFRCRLRRLERPWRQTRRQDTATIAPSPFQASFGDVLVAVDARKQFSPQLCKCQIKRSIKLTSLPFKIHTASPSFPPSLLGPPFLSLPCFPSHPLPFRPSLSSRLNPLKGRDVNSIILLL